MANLYSDENFPDASVLELRKLGHDVLTALDAGQANQKIPDAQVLTYAHSLGRAVFDIEPQTFHPIAQAHQGSLRDRRLHFGHGFPGSRSSNSQGLIG